MRLFLILTQTLFVLLSFAQEDSLLKIINDNDIPDTTKISAINDLGDILSYEKPDSALFYWKKALDIINKSDIPITDKHTYKAVFYNNIGWYYKFVGKLDSASIFYNKSIKLDSLNNNKIDVAYSLINLGSIYLQKGEYDLAEYYIKKSLEIGEGFKDSTVISHCYNYLGSILNSRGKTKDALNYYNKSLNIRQALNDSVGVSVIYNNMADIYEKKGDVLNALEFNNKSLSICEAKHDYQGMIYSLNNIANIFFSQDDTIRAVKYYKKSLEISKKIGDSQSEAYTMINLGSIYKKQKKYNKAISEFNKSIAIFKNIDDVRGLAVAYSNKGAIYLNLVEIDSSLFYFNKGLKIWRKLNEPQKIASTYINIAYSYFKNNDINKAEEYGVKAYNLSKELGFPEEISDAALLLSRIYEHEHNINLSFKYYKEGILMRDSVLNMNNYKKLQREQAKYEYKKKAAIDSIAHAKEIKIKDLEIANRKKEEAKKATQRNFFFIALVLSLGLIIVVYNSYKRKRKYAETLAKQKAEIERIHKSLSDSIDYATKIQTAVLPDINILTKFFTEYSLLYMPKDKVSGDFYWWYSFGNKIIITVADCTGHGVPGAFMSMLGVSLLREIILKEKIIRPDIILNVLREEIIKTLQQKGIENEQKDGMDMSIVIIDSETLNMQFAGAYNPIYVISENKNFSANSKVKSFSIVSNTKVLYEVKADRMPVSIYRKMDMFQQVDLQLQKGDTIYLLTDGYIDQFGGKNKRKFKSKKLKKILL